MNSHLETNLLLSAEKLKTPITSPQFPAQMDAQDQLSHKRDLYHIPQTNTLIRTTNDTPSPGDAVYLTGNSLGLQPKSLKGYLNDECDKWIQCGVQGHFSGAFPWLNVDDFLRERMAKIVGGRVEEVGVMNTLTTNLHLMMVSFYRPTAQRHKLMMLGGCFPSDRYLGLTNVVSKDFDPEESLVFVHPKEGCDLFETSDILEAIEREGDSLACVLFSGIKYNTGQFFDIPAITQAAHAVGAYAGFDLAHAAGNVVLNLHDWDVDFACWCTYKYLNSGPGGIGGFFIHEKHHHENLPRYGGWWGHNLDTRFDMTYDFDPIPGAYGYRLSNPNVMAVMSLYSSLETFDGVEFSTLREKSVLLTGYMEYLIDHELENVSIITPRNPDERGCQLSIKIKSSMDNTKLEEELANNGVICDVRGPIIRVAPTPLYNSFTDVRNFVDVLKKILTE